MGGFEHQPDQIRQLKIANRIAPNLEGRGVARRQLQRLENADGFQVRHELR